MSILEPLSPVQVEDAILPLKQIAFYHGVQNGFYFGYLITFTAFLLPLSLVGLGAWVYNIIDTDEALKLNRRLLPFTCIFTSIWMSFFFETWKRRQKTLAYAFESEEAKEVPVLCRNFSGRFEIDRLDQTVTQTNKFPTIWRRLIWEVPIFLIFGAAAVLATIYIDKIKEIIDDGLKDGSFNTLEHRIFTVLNSIFEAVAMLSLNWGYDKVSEITVEWENHK